MHFLKKVWENNKAVIIEYAIVAMLVGIVACGAFVALTES